MAAKENVVQRIQERQICSIITTSLWDPETALVRFRCIRNFTDYGAAQRVAREMGTGTAFCLACWGV